MLFDEAVKNKFELERNFFSFFLSDFADKWEFFAYDRVC